MFCYAVDELNKSVLRYLITAPLSLRLDAVETVLLQLFGFTAEVTVHVFLKTSMAPDHVVLAREVVTLNTQNHHQAIAKVRLAKSVSHVILHVQSNEINQHLSIPVSRSNGFLFIQTDKPLYTPHQSVKVRAFSLNQELRPANRSVFLTFKDPDQITVDIVEMFDVNNGIPSMQNPFKIPVKPKLGIWSIEASYSNDFTTTARTDFEVKEYVLPSLAIHVEPEANYISQGSFNRFSFKVSARYLHGAPVADAEVFLRYGYVSGKNPPVIIPKSITRERFAAVKFVQSPYRLSLVSTPLFIKPGLPYNIQVLVKDHLDQPVNRVPVRLVERRLFRQGGESEDMPCPDSANSQSDGLAVFICNTPSQGVRAVLKFETADITLQVASQAALTLEASAYHSPNQRYLYIDAPLPGHGLEVGSYASIKVYSLLPRLLMSRLPPQVLSKGKVVDFGSKKFVSSADNKQTLIFEVTGAMVPSVRLLVYYILYGEGTSELVADSVWLDVRAKCVEGLQTDVSLRSQNLKPKQNLQLNVRTNQNGLLALSAVDSALFPLRPNYRDPVSMVLRHIEQSDRGCGGGGGRDSADVFRLAGLTFITNANTQPSSSSETCTAAVRPKRALTEEDRAKKVNSYGSVKTCCEEGMQFIPKSVTCLQFAVQKYRKHPNCRRAFRECCEFYQQNLDQNQNLVLGRHGHAKHTASRYQTHVITVPNTQYQTHGITVPNTKKENTTMHPHKSTQRLELKLTACPLRPQYCVTLEVGPALCLLQSKPTSRGLQSTSCSWSTLHAGGIGAVTFTLMGLEPGEHSLTFTLKTQGGARDVLQKKLRVVPEGVRQEVYSGGRLDPQGLYGSEKRTVELKNQVPTNIVPNTAVERMLMINGEILGEVLSVMHSPEGLRQLVNLPAGSAGAELDGLVLLVQVYQYLETSRSWNVLGGDIQKNSANLKQRIRDGLVGISTFRNLDSSYSMWEKRESSTWLTAQAVRTLSTADQLLSVDHQLLSESVSWLIRNTQQPDGSFTDKSSFRAEGTTAVEKSVYLTSFVLIALHRATRIRDPILQLRHPLCVCPGNPVELRYWQESSVTTDWLKPDQSSGLTVETTAYVLLTALLKGRIQYSNPILSWLTQDQHYGEGFFSVQDTALTLEALSEYSKVVSRAVLNQDINIRYRSKGSLGQVQLSQSRPVATPIQVTKNDDITVSTGYGRGVSNVKMRTVYYQTTASTQTRCNFDITIEVASPSDSDTPHLVACAKYKPPPNELFTESSLTVMKIQLPTGVEAYLDDLRQVSAVLTQHPSMDPSAAESNLEAVSSGTEVELVKKATCSSVDLQKDKQYLVMGGGGAELRLDQSFRYRLPLDSDALVEAWPTDCSSPECLDYVSQLEDFALDLQLIGCP
uniref:Complement C5 n=1 Tax=Acanthochromis polyacanthus TaxID=80966 RepID=A0A3Q1GK75_9TELE